MLEIIGVTPVEMTVRCWWRTDVLVVEVEQEVVATVICDPVISVRPRFRLKDKGFLVTEFQNFSFRSYKVVRI